MPVEYSATDVDLFFPARRGQFFRDMPAANDAAFCAEMARLAYFRKEPVFPFDKDGVTAVLAAQGFSAQFFESQGTPAGVGTHCFLAINAANNVAIVSFRGTDATDPIDICADGDLLQQDWGPGGKVHTGFAQAFAHIADDLLHALDAVTCRTLYIGHSLGAALATLLASLRPPDHLYTIGSPRVGDAAFVATLNRVNSSRFVDCCDVVTHVPLAAVLGSYQHVGPPCYIAADRSISLDPGEGFINADCVRATLHYLRNYGLKFGNLPSRQLADHSPINYVEALKATRCT